MKDSNMVWFYRVFLAVIIIIMFTVEVGIIIDGAAYKKGQLDYARNKIEYTIDNSGRVIHYLTK